MGYTRKKKKETNRKLAEFLKKGQPGGVYLISWKFPLHSIFMPEFPEFSVEWFASRNFKGRMESAQGQPCEVIQIFGNFLLGIIVIKLNFLLRGILV